MTSVVPPPPSARVERNIRLLLEYDGTPFVGWQFQQGLESVEGHLKRALQTITQEPITLTAAGRTDAGVHAMGQVVNFRTSHAMHAFRFGPALNRLLPPSISVHRAEYVPEHFDARRSAVSKHYRYQIYQARQPAALEANRSWYVPHPIAIDAMREAARSLIGELDFESFRSAHCDAEHAVREMFAIAIDEVARPPLGRLIEIKFHADAFCRHMCRILAGTLLEVGIGQRSVGSVSDALLARDRAAAGMTAPSHGLTLVEVVYPADALALDATAVPVFVPKHRGRKRPPI